MEPESGVVPLALDLTRGGHRSVTSLYSNLVTRPTGRAVRLGLESQLAEMPGSGLCVSVLDFGSVRVLDYSCADEIVAKLLLGFRRADAGRNVYLLVRGVHDHHQDAIEAVLERHGLVVVGEMDGGFVLLGAANPVQRACWASLLRLGRAGVPEVAAAAGVAMEAAATALAGLVAHRVAVCIGDTGLFCPLPALVSI